jgi:hypothetical protein
MKNGPKMMPTLGPRLMDSRNVLMNNDMLHQEDIEEWSKRDELDDMFAQTMHRILTQDPTLLTLDIINPLDWDDFDRWRNKNGCFNMNAWLRPIAALLHLASKIPYIEQLDLTSTNMYPKADAMFWTVIDLLSCNN